MIIACTARDCPAVIEVAGPVAPAATFTCRWHTVHAEDSVRFQDSQFSPLIGNGTDPRAYEHGHAKFGTMPETKRSKAIKDSAKSYRARVVEQARHELDGHDHAAEILELLNLDVRDRNSGTDKK
jgi:hypothetical protein